MAMGSLVETDKRTARRKGWTLQEAERWKQDAMQH